MGEQANEDEHEQVEGREQGSAFASGKIDSFGDHRIAMSFAIASLRAAGAIEIRDVANVATSFPGFVPLAQSVGSTMVLPCDVEDVASMDALFAALAEKWGSLDFLVHAIAFSDKNELKGRYADTTRTNFMRTMLISCFSFTELAKLMLPEPVLVKTVFAPSVTESL